MFFIGNKITLYFALVLSIAACTNENYIPTDKDVKALFAASISMPETKVPIESGENIPIGNKVGIFALTYTGANESSVVWPSAQGSYQTYNLEGTTLTGTPQKVTTTTSYYYPGGQKIAFYSYYPRTATPVFNSGTAPTIDVNIASSPTTQSDCLYATPLTGTSLAPAVNFQYNHALSLIRMKFQKTCTDVLTLKTITITTVQKQRATMNIATGGMTSTNLTGGLTSFLLSGLSSAIPLKGDASAPLALTNSKFLFIPATTISSIKFTLRISGESTDREYTISNPALTLVKGAAINVELTVSIKEAVISNWSEINDTEEIGGVPAANLNCNSSKNSFSGV